jgi:hypothetical protein
MAGADIMPGLSLFVPVAYEEGLLKRKVDDFNPILRYTLLTII